MGEARRAGDPAIELRLLGPLEVSRGGAVIALGGPKPRALLAVLALEPGHIVSVDGLVEALWPGETPDTAAHAVQVYVSQLRKALGADLIPRRAPGYALELEPKRIDIHRFVQLAGDGRETLAAGDAAASATIFRESLGLWRGPALADFLYEPFAQTEIARLEELRTVVLEERIEADLALGRHGELVSELEALVQAQPLRERPRAQLMLALYRSGRQADALAAYRSARETLVQELGIDPGPELRQLEAAILRQDESLLLEIEPARPAMQFRRLATILFVDIVESMALGEVLDAETIGSVQRRYFEAISAAVVRHGGTIEKYAGDAVMAAFGVPVSHEDDALRAARAAFEIQAGVKALNGHLMRDHGLQIEVRIGIAAGEVVTTATGDGQRFVAGDPVGIAARLEQAAEPGEIVVGEVVARLIDHAARLEPRGALEIAGRRKPFQMFRLREIVPVAPAFQRRLDAPLVGRKRELAALRKSLKRAVDSDATHVTLVVAPPGVGKSRLAAEFTRRTKRATTLWGRCLSYGEGITYWPLREVLEQAESGIERDAVLAALDAETPPPAPEVALLVRQLCEALARERPLVLVFDDVHWAEPTFLELVEHLADKGGGPIHVVCLAREEFSETRPSFLEARGNVDRIEVDALSTEEIEALVDGLGGAILDSDQRTRVVDAAEGNPLFLEQLLALALEGGLAGERLPETIQALLAARLDRLGPGERAVLERGAVVGKRFSADDVVALLEPNAAPTADAYLATLVGRGFLRPGEDGAFGFRHVLVQEAVYRSAPKRLRAELHERYADRLDTVSADLPELDEFVGYHLEQAYRLRTELGESDRRTERLAEDGGRRLGVAGIRAMKRGDVPASVGLLRRATSMLLQRSPLQAELLCELGLSLGAGGDPDEAIEVLQRAIEHARVVPDQRVEMRARMELEYLQTRRISGSTGDALLDVTSAAIGVFEVVGDERLIGRARLLAGWVHGARRGQHRAREKAAEEALAHYGRSTWPISTTVGEIADALYHGPVPVPDAIDRCHALLRTTSLDRYGRANVEVSLGGLVAQLGEFSHARALIGSARGTFEELGQRASAAPFSATILGDVELLAGDMVLAEVTFRWLCHELAEIQAFSHLASRAGDLADVLYLLGRLDESAEWIEVATTHSAVDDIDALIRWMPVHAKIQARHGALTDAVATARDAVRLAQTTDALNRHAKTQQDLGEILLLAGRADDACAAFGDALELYEEKGNLVGAEYARSLLDEVTRV
ncbi:MAG: AAA family ATPase [Thermoleophilia bacterium]|nr:AAA family ATPase [Thermoleophilia bacterium]MDH5279831.1 AAA family ATPase [Thermoleophilia bacterium]